MNINEEVREGSVEIDSDNNLEQFKIGSGTEEAVQIHDFQIVSEFVLVLSPSRWASSAETFCVLSKVAKP